MLCALQQQPPRNCGILRGPERSRHAWGYNPLEQRSQRRTYAAIPVEIRGVDAQGQSFEETTEAVEVSRRGLSIHTLRDLPLHSSLTVVLPGRGPVRPGEGPSDFFASAAVVGVRPEGETKRVSLRFVGATLATYTAETA